VLARQNAAQGMIAEFSRSRCGIFPQFISPYALKLWREPPMATNKPRHGYERKRSQLATKTKDETRCSLLPCSRKETRTACAKAPGKNWF
jgi:hypothetical protein